MNSFSLPAEQTRGPEAGLSICAALTFEVARPMFRDAEMWSYRHRTIAMLRRYLRISIEVGRLPSLLGRELFRSKVTSYNMSSFEDGVIFVHDVEHALEQLSEFGQRLVATIVFQDYTQDEAAEVLHCARRTVCREFPEAVDRISELFLDGGLLNRLPSVPVENSCQEGKEVLFTQVIGKKQNKFLQSMAQFPSQYAMLEIRVRKKGAPKGTLFSFCPPVAPYAERSAR